MHLHQPTIVTDCLGLLQVVDAGFQKAISHKSVLARLWRLTRHVLHKRVQKAKDKRAMAVSLGRLVQQLVITSSDAARRIAAVQERVLQRLSNSSAV